MTVIRTTVTEIDKMMREARQEAAVKGWVTRRGRHELRRLYDLEDMREPLCLDDSVGFLERLHGLEDPR